MATKTKARKQVAVKSATDTLPVAPTRPRPLNGVMFTKETAKLVSKVEHDTKAEANPRAAVLTAFGRVGGVRWLVKYAKRDPKGFAGLLAKAMPQDVNVTGTMGYVPMAIPVETRDAIPGEFTEVIPQSVVALIEEPDPFT